MVQLSRPPNGADLIQLVRGLFVITDPGRDQDDEDTLVAANRFVRLGILDVMGVVANLKPSIQRARLARGTLNVLGLNDVPVGFGTGHEAVDADDSLPYEFRVGYLAPPEDVVDGATLIVDSLRKAPPKGVILTLISTLSDAAKVLITEPQLFIEKVRRVVIMGGVVADGDYPKLDVEGLLIPDLTAQNHAFDKDATGYLYRQLQKWGIPITVLSRHAATVAKVPRSMYEDMAATGHILGIRLRDAQGHAIQELWRRANLPDGDTARLGLPGRCDKQWFCNTFCGGRGLERSSSDSIWDVVETFNLYDPCTLLAAMPGLREYFFSPYIHEHNGAEHMVIGLNPTRHGVVRPAELGEYLKTALVESLMMSLEYGQNIAV